MDYAVLKSAAILRQGEAAAAKQLLDDLDAPNHPRRWPIYRSLKPTWELATLQQIDSKSFATWLKGIILAILACSDC